jgi:hypothetical protein
MPNDKFKLVGHGIKVSDLAVANTVPLADLAVTPRSGAFTQVAAVLQSSDFSPEIRIGALWGMLPGVERFPLKGSGINRPLAVERTVVPGPARAGADVYPLPRNVEYVAPKKAAAPVGGEQAWRAERERIREFLATYPLLNDFDFLNATGSAQLGLNSDGTFSVCLCWEEEEGESADDVLDRHSTTYLGERLAFPRVGANQLPAHPITIWWAILFCLSMLARYEPDAWAKYVDVQKSPDAVPIEALLDIAINTLPETIHRAILNVAK